MYSTYDNQFGAIENYGKLIVAYSHVWLEKRFCSIVLSIVSPK